ncbi:MAG: thioredoxin fold domain-containing protein [Bacteroidales bacterium]|nr:thioredoxin fold domain-containing protein [Bacteroidales bacterium]
MKLKNIIPLVLSALFIAILIIALLSKNDINKQLSVMLREQFREDVDESVPQIIDSLYNYGLNGEAFEITFLEFGAENCSACRKMVKVLDETRKVYGSRVNVVFLNAMQPFNQELMKYYGVASIPTQVLLDKEGEEYFRHSGYISLSDLENSFN